MKKQITHVLAALLFSAAMIGCDSGRAIDEPTPEDWAATVSANVESVTVEPMAEKSADGEDQFLATITFIEHPTISLPDAINVLAQAAGKVNEPVVDDGSGVDTTPGDGVFTGIVSSACVPEPTEAAAGKIPGISCKLDIVAPGSECGTFGLCPKDVHRNFLWGLIEYDTKVVFCACLSECEFSL